MGADRNVPEVRNIPWLQKKGPNPQGSGPQFLMLSLVALGGLAVALYYDLPTQLLNALTQKTQSSQETAKKEPVSAAAGGEKTAPKPHAKPRSEKAVTRAKAAKPATAQAARAKLPRVEAPPRRIPTPADVHEGMPERGLLSAFGRPDLKTTSRDHGRLIEEFVYTDRQSNATTVVKLRENAVVSVTGGIQ